MFEDVAVGRAAGVYGLAGGLEAAAFWGSAPSIGIIGGGGGYLQFGPAAGGAEVRGYVCEVLPDELGPGVVLGFAVELVEGLAGGAAFCFGGEDGSCDGGGEGREGDYVCSSQYVWEGGRVLGGRTSGEGNDGAQGCVLEGVINIDGGESWASPGEILVSVHCVCLVSSRLV